LFPEGFPSHFDLNKVHEELSRSEPQTYAEHPSGQLFASIAQDILTWKAKAANWSDCGQFPKFGDHNNLLVQKILLWDRGTELPMAERTPFEQLDVEFLFTEGAVPGPFSFWAGSRWADEAWVNTYITLIEPTWAVGKYQGKDLNILRRAALPSALKSQHEAGILTLTSKVDALMSSSTNFDVLTRSLTGKFDMLTSKVDTLTSSPKTKSDDLDGDTTVETDKPTMAMISDLQTRNAKLEPENSELLKIIEAQGIYFQDRGVAMTRVLEKVLNMDEGVISAMETEEWNKMKGTGSLDEDV